MHQALCVREVLANIFRSLELGDLFNCALVCEDWTDVALDPLWREVDLMAIPLPFSSGYSSTQEMSVGLSRPLKLADWERFEWYGRRIRTLLLDFDVFHELPERLFSEMALKRSTSALLPNLRRLEISPSSAETLSFPLLFMSENVTELLFRIPGRRDDYGDLYEYTQDFFLRVSERMPRLKSLEIRTPRFSENANYSSAASNIDEFLSSEKSLETFICPPYFIAPHVLVELSHLPNLRAIKMGRQEGFGNLPRRSRLRLDGWRSPGPFPQLVDLSLCTTFYDAIDLMELDLAPKLEVLHIHSPESETGDSTRRLLLVLERKHPKLLKLRLGSLGSNVNGRLQLPDGGDDIDENTLLPLLNFTNLVGFEFTYHRQLRISNYTMKKFLSRLPALEVLNLCGDPFLDEQPILSCKTLPIIAECCPKLRRLSLYLDTHVSEFSSPIRFPSLERIEFGKSPLVKEDISEFALFLSDVLPPSCNVESICDVSWSGLVEQELKNNGLKALNGDWTNWSELSKILSLLLRARSRERSCVLDSERRQPEISPHLEKGTPVT